MGHLYNLAKPQAGQVEDVSGSSCIRRCVSAVMFMPKIAPILTAAQELGDSFRMFLLPTLGKALHYNQFGHGKSPSLSFIISIPFWKKILCHVGCNQQKTLQHCGMFVVKPVELLEDCIEKNIKKSQEVFDLRN